MPPEKPIGIDLGTTNSAMAWVDAGGRSAMIPNAEGELITPSVVYFSESEVVVGKNARTAITAHPDMVAQWVKRDMGAALLLASDPRPLPAARSHSGLHPEEAQGRLVRALGPDLQAVITVPAYFDELRRKATADAGEMAGLRGAGYRQRADRRGHRLRREPRAISRPTARPRQPTQRAGL